MDQSHTQAYNHKAVHHSYDRYTPKDDPFVTPTLETLLTLDTGPPP